eukprot:TRINITY_DN31345_c0_g1_i1.p1 TRINITY_DN31345_c0_g1~~TRINITY_DN31345_c0_g1_i1.p1  ORF type:complete len:237 (-),score=66.18 TRINITY_DN31345_c0_g1_i1:72-782(-)
MEPKKTETVEKSETPEGTYPRYAEIIRSVVAELSQAVARNKVGPDHLLDFVIDFFRERQGLQQWRRGVYVEDKICRCLYDRLMKSKGNIISMEVLSLNAEVCGIEDSLLDALQTLFGWNTTSEVDWRAFLFATMMFSGDSVASTMEHVMGVFPDGRVPWEVIEIWMDTLAQVDRKWAKRAETGEETFGDWRKKIEALKENLDAEEEKGKQKEGVGEGVTWMDLAPVFEREKRLGTQ